MNKLVMASVVLLSSVLSVQAASNKPNSKQEAKAPNLVEASLSSQIPYPFYDVQKSSEGKMNRLMVLNSGIAALEMRLDMIKKAQSNIEVEYFIFGTDASSKLITQALVKAANRGVTVRMLVDKSAAIFVLEEKYAKALSEVGKDGGSIELRYYNAASLIRFSSINFRNHRKLISVDDKYAITGGRNIEDDYFDLSEEYNFLDRDVYVSGDMAKTMRESFDKYFEAPITEIADLPKEPKATYITQDIVPSGEVLMVDVEKKNTTKINEFNEMMKPYRDFLIPTAEDDKLRQRIKEVGANVLSKKKMHTCPELTYSTDRPGGNMWRRLVDRYSDDYRYLRKTLYDKMSNPDLTRVILSSPYMLNNEYSKDLMYSMLERDVELVMYTNSLSSTDAVYVAANLYDDVFNWVGMGLQFFLHDGHYFSLGDEPITEGVKTAVWGTHSKTQVYETKEGAEVMIGTYNIDNRSNHYNTEMALFCKGSKEISDEVMNSINHRIRNGIKVNADGTATNYEGKKVDVLGSDDENETLMNIISLPSRLFKGLL